MQKILKKIKEFKKILYDLVISSFILSIIFFLKAYRKRGPENLPVSTTIFKFFGILPINNHYYQPKFFFNQREKKKFDKRYLKNLNLNVKKQKNLLKKLNFSNELINLNLIKKTKNFGFKLENGSFEYGDAEIYYQIIRKYNPKKIIEIGSGHSTLIALEAVKKNLFLNSTKTSITCIEPFENKWLENFKINLIRQKIEDLKFDISKNLNKNDILFIDSSHIINPDNDVLKLYLEILPKLKKGVIIHIHDIFTPRNYLNDWVFNKIRFWNEQYLVETMLINSKKYEILLSLNYLKNEHFKYLKTNCPYLKKIHQPSSLWLRVN